MPVAVSYPGVYVEEIPSGVRTISGVATSIAAFVDFFPQGPTGSSKAVQIFSYADFQRNFGGLNANSEASYAIQQFFLNGGSTAFVIRVVSNGANATVDIDNSAATKVLTATAKNAGAYGDTIRVDIDYATANPTTTFNLTVTQYDAATSTNVVASEKFLNLVVDATQPNDAAKTVTAGSQLIDLAETAGSVPLPSGTASAALPATYPTFSTGGTTDVWLGDKTTATSGVKVGTITMPAAAGDIPANYPDLAAMIQSQLRKIMTGTKFAMPNATVSVIGGPLTPQFMIVKANAGEPTTFINFVDGTGSIQSALKFTLGPQQFALDNGGDGDVDWTTKGAAMATAIIGDQSKKTGMYALLDVDEFNILCIPATMKMGDSDAFQVATDATALCTQRRAMYILDAPQKDATRDTPTAMMNWLGNYDSLRSSNSAVYYPRTTIPDPLNAFADRLIAPSGTMAGIYARTDTSRGVWKAPAGTDASLLGVEKLEYNLTDGENGVLNPLAINCLRNFPVYGPVAWGARTLRGADAISDDYKYIPVRRLALYIEESLFRGTKWVVFEPNAAPLWAQVRLNVGSFMQNLFQQGAFFGSTPKDAYFVTCDATNNPPDTINLGIINIAVGFAPLKPAEFVVLQIQQIAQAAS